VDIFHELADNGLSGCRVVVGADSRNPQILVISFIPNYPPRFKYELLNGTTLGRVSQAKK